MRRIPLTKGYHAIVDNEDYDGLMEFAWRVKLPGYWTRTLYAVGTFYYGGKPHIIGMHRILCSPLPLEEVDHRDGNGLNNQKFNLRQSTRRQNGSNQLLRVTSRSGFKGISWSERDRCWYAQLTTSQRKIHIGCFREPKSAALAYDKAALSHFGEFAKTNAMLGLI